MLTTHLHSRPFSSSSQSRSSLLFIFTQPHRKSLCHPPQAHCSTRPGLRLASCRCTWVPFSRIRVIWKPLDGFEPGIRSGGEACVADISGVR
uniref:Uncharacterized protein n=1 Tax=Glycine max TaxID=3847 RepID=A0A0R0L6A4_SOYBN